MVITFPQGTTKSFARSQGNSAYYKTARPIVVPIVIDGFRRSSKKRTTHEEERNPTILSLKNRWTLITITTLKKL
jgi:hypothetical protein